MDRKKRRKMSKRGKIRLAALTGFSLLLLTFIAGAWKYSQLFQNT